MDEIDTLDLDHVAETLDHVAEVIQRISKQRDELAEALRELVSRCDGPEGVRADGSNIQTIQAHAVLAKAEE